MRGLCFKKRYTVHCGVTRTLLPVQVKSTKLYLRELTNVHPFALLLLSGATVQYTPEVPLL